MVSYDEADPLGFAVQVAALGARSASTVPRDVGAAPPPDSGRRGGATALARAHDRRVS